MPKLNHALTGANRTRRSIAKGAVLAIGVLFGLSASGRRASAHHGGDYGGDGGGCFLRGTRIRTASGYHRIEKLVAGDLLPTHFGGLQPIERIGRYTEHKPAAGASWPADAQPVLVKRSALDHNVPTTDVYLSPAHAVFVDGLLIPVGDLVNGRTIVRAELGGMEEIDYFHVELKHHDLIDAEGMACESLRPAGSDAHEGVEEAPCTPIVSFNGRRNELKSRLRSAMSPLVDRRTALDIARDRLEERGLAA